MEPHYSHRQTGWVVVVAIVSGLLLLAPVLAIPGVPWSVLVPAAILVLAGLVFSTLTVEVDERELRAFFSFGLVKKSVPLETVRRAEAVQNPWYYGWGIHKIPGGWIWNVSGSQAVELSLGDGSRVRLGSDEPLALLRAIETALPQLDATAGGSAPAARSRTGPLAVAGLLTVLAVAGLIVAAVVAQTRPPTVTVSPTRLAVETPFYGDEYPLSDITAVSLEPCLPRILARTNGFAAGGLLRGWFQVERLGRGKLFVDAGNPPFVLVRLRQGFVIVNRPEARRTQALYEEIQAMRGGR